LIETEAWRMKVVGHQAGVWPLSTEIAMNSSSVHMTTGWEPQSTGMFGEAYSKVLSMQSDDIGQIGVHLSDLRYCKYSEHIHKRSNLVDMAKTLPIVDRSGLPMAGYLSESIANLHKNRYASDGGNVREIKKVDNGPAPCRV
jgi:hypothetical protein